MDLSEKPTAVVPYREQTRYVIYCHTNRVNGKRYVGQTSKTIGRRWYEHVNAARNNLNGCRHFHAAIRKYGPDVFDHEILDIVTSRAGADAAERVWIKQRRCLVPDGYNLTTGGSTHTQHEETRRILSIKISAAKQAVAPEVRSEIARKREASRTTEGRAAWLVAQAAAVKDPAYRERRRRDRAAMTPEQLAFYVESGRRSRAVQLSTTTSEQRSESTCRGWAKLSVEQRAERMRKMWANRSPEQRAARADGGGRNA